VNVPLKHYIGQCVTVVFEVADCSRGAHFGYAYVDASCSPLSTINSSQYFCGQKNINLTGPPGESEYKWTGPKGGIISRDTLQSIKVDSAGTYTLVVTPFTGAACADTLLDSIGTIAGPPPVPSFTADTVCIGAITTFTNTSTPVSGKGVSFYWDFYNLGIYDDTATNPTWLYKEPGIYPVLLHEVVNGCGVDTIVNVFVDSIPKSQFVADTVCAKDTTYFKNTSVGTTSWSWNFGNPTSGFYNISTQPNPNHVYDSAGIYKVTLLVNNPGVGCPPSSITKEIKVLPLPVPVISASADTVCAGTRIQLSVKGGTSYVWSNGNTTTTITASADSLSTWFVTAYLGKCLADTSILIRIKPVAKGSLSGTKLICYGDTVTLIAMGGGTYVWNNGATTSSIKVKANSFSDTSYYVTIINGDSCLTRYQNILVDSVPVVSACCDTVIIKGTSVVISGGGSAKHYLWSPATGLNCDTCPYPIATPTVNTTYTVTALNSNGCPVTGTVTVDITIPCDSFIVPNVFTPNGDGINDVFLIKALYMSKYSIDIYNRWGQQVFSSSDPETPWDGTISGKGQAPDGVYYYILTATCADGKSYKRKGFVQIIR
jgi:gliding motility-associated-like protein